MSTPLQGIEPITLADRGRAIHFEAGTSGHRQSTGKRKMSRQPITPELLQAMGAELADVPASGERATAHAATFEALMAMITELRTLPLKDVEPAVIYAPEELRR